MRHLQPALSLTSRGLARHILSHGRRSTPRSALVIQAHTQRRFFGHALAVDVVNFVQGAIFEIHSLTSFHWAITLPLYAIISTSLIRLPFTIATHKFLQKRAKLRPIVTAIDLKAKRDWRASGLSEDEKIKAADKQSKKEREALFKRWGVQWWKAMGGLIGVPLLVINLDGLRRLCGGGQGLISRLLGLAPPEAPLQPLTDHSAVLGDALPPSPDMFANSAVDAALAAGADPTLLTGGALWFPNLLLPDPFYILPVALSICLALSPLPRSPAGLAQIRDLNTGQPGHTPLPALTIPGEDGKVETPLSRFSLRAARGGMLAGASVGLIMADMPAALQLYWFTSAAAGLAAKRILDWRLPIETRMVKPASGVLLPFLSAKWDHDTSPKVDLARSIAANEGKAAPKQPRKPRESRWAKAEATKSTKS